MTAAAPISVSQPRKVGDDNPTFAPVTSAVQMTSGDATAIKDQILAKQVVVTSNADAIGFHDRVFASDERNPSTNLGRAILLKDAIYDGDQLGLKRGK